MSRKNLVISVFLVFVGVVLYSQPCPLFAQSCISNIDIEVDDVITFSSETEDSDGGALSGYSVSFSSSNSGVASVQDNGNGTASVTGQGEGTANITTTASKGGETFTSVVSVDVTEPEEEGGGGGEVVFHSDWSTGTGDTDGVIRDTGQSIPWSTLSGNGTDSADVVSASGLNFPAGMSNVLFVRAANPNAGGSASRIMRVTGAWSAPSDGESLYYRTYLRQVVPDTVSTGSAHPIQDGNATGDTNWELSPRSDDNSSTWYLRFNSNATAFPNSHFKVLGLSKETTYRIEWQIHRLSSTTFNLHVRVYNSSGTLLYDDDDFANANGTVTLADNPTLTFRNVSNLTGLNYGTNGAFQGNTAEDFPADFYYGGGMCVRTDTWCGEYSGGI